MSTIIKNLAAGLLLLVPVLIVVRGVPAQPLEVELTLADDRVADVEGSLPESDGAGGMNWSFVPEHADATGLERRIRDLRLFDADGREIGYTEFAGGEFRAERPARRFAYRVDLTPLGRTAANAHVSWAGNERALLLPYDLLPAVDGRRGALELRLDLPRNWRVASGERSTGEHRFLIEDPENAVLLAGADLRRREITVAGRPLGIALLGEWQFPDEMAAEMAAEILAEYADLFGDIPFRRADIFLAPFPADVGLDRWRAETRGRSVVILSSPMIAESFARQRLHEQLRHEIFHLWIPNALRLGGDYAWFYEGFAVYQALKTGLRLGRIRFEDFLNTLETANFLEQKRSPAALLAGDGRGRWTASADGSNVYARGMLVAFLSDAAVLSASGGRKDLRDVFRELYREGRREPEGRDANAAVLGVLRGRAELTPLIDRYVAGGERIDWAKYLPVFGIEDRGTRTNADLVLGSRLTGRQKALLKKLGYNSRRNYREQKIIRNVN